MEKQLHNLITLAQLKLVNINTNISINGLLDVITYKTINEYLTNKWSTNKKIIFIAQKYLKEKGFKISVDGYFGPETEYYVEKFFVKETIWRYDNEFDDTIFQSSTKYDLNPNNWPTYKNIEKFYGTPGTNHTTFTCPFILRLAWNTETKVNKITCNKKIKTSLEKVLVDIKENYSKKDIRELGIDLYGGCYNNRKMRGGSQLSTHAYAVAIDLNPANNKLKWDSSRAVFAKPEYAKMIDAFLKEGWVSLGKSKNYDWMHFQAVKLK